MPTLRPTSRRRSRRRIVDQGVGSGRRQGRDHRRLVRRSQGCDRRDHARQGVRRVGAAVIVEEFLEGRETSHLHASPTATLASCSRPRRTTSKARDGDEGLNTGGIGAYSPVPWLATATRQQAVDEVVMPLIGWNGRPKAIPFRGCFYAGLMFTAKGPRLIEVNVRFGDPETQVAHAATRPDLYELLEACASGSAGIAEGRSGAGGVDDAWSSHPTGIRRRIRTASRSRGSRRPRRELTSSCSTPGRSSTGTQLVSAGGRVLNVSALGDDLPQARDRAYEAVGKIQMRNKHAGTDIAKGIR